AVHPLARVSVLKQVRAIEVDQPVFVGREVRWHPVEDDADALLVKVVHKVHEVLRTAVAGGRREEARRLVAPGAVEGMLHDGQELDMSVVHAVDMVGKRLRQLAVGQRAVALFGDAPPRADVDLVDVDWSVQGVLLVAGRPPALVVPLVVEVSDDRASPRRHLAEEGERVRLLHLVVVVMRDNAILVDSSRPDARHDILPDPRLSKCVKRMTRLVPTVEVADEEDLARVGRPHAERGADQLAAGGRSEDRVSTKFVIELEMAALVEEIEVLVAEDEAGCLLGLRLARCRRRLLTRWRRDRLTG